MSDTFDRIRLITPDDPADLVRIAAKLAEPRIGKWFWEDSFRQNLTLAFVLLFANPSNIVLDLDGDGVFSFVGIINGWRATLHAAIWGPKAARKPDLHRAAIGVAMKMRGLLVVEAVAAVNNRASNMALKRAGFTFRGTIPKTAVYNGDRVDANWYEITREDLGLGASDG